MLRSLLPRERSLPTLLHAGAEHLLAGVVLLPQALGAGGGGAAPAAAAALRDLERTAAETASEVVRRINASLVLPWGRGDTYDLARALHGCLGHLVAAADLAERCAARPPVAAVDVVAVLHRQAELTVAAMPLLERARDLADYWVEVDRLRRHAGSLHRAALAALLEPPLALLDAAAGGPGAGRGAGLRPEDVRAALLAREVLAELDGAARAFAAIAQRVERIALEST